MDRTVPVLLLDLDGVLNPFAASVCPDGYQERVLFEGQAPERYCVAHGGWIRELAAIGNLASLACHLDLPGSARNGVFVGELEPELQPRRPLDSESCPPRLAPVGLGR